MTKQTQAPEIGESLPGSLIEALIALALIAVSVPKPQMEQTLQEYAALPNEEAKRVFIVALTERLKTGKGSLSLETPVVDNPDVATTPKLRRPQVHHICPECEQEFMAYEEAKYCGPRCRHAAFRKRRKLEQAQEGQAATAA